MSNVPENKTLNEILNGNEKVLTAVYKSVYKTMEKYGTSIKLPEADVKEAVQDAFEAFYRQLLHNKIKLSCSVQTYIISIAKKNLLLNDRQLSFRLKAELIEAENLIIENSENEELEETIREKRRNLYKTIYKTLPIECQQIIALTLKGYNSLEIAETLNLLSEFYVRTKRMKCKQYLIEKIKEDPDYEKLSSTNPEDYELSVWEHEH